MGVTLGREMPGMIPNISVCLVTKSLPLGLNCPVVPTILHCLMPSWDSRALRDAGASQSRTASLGVVVHECARLYGVQIVRNMGAEAIVGANSEHVGRLRSVGAAEVWELSMERLLSRINELHVVYDPMG